MGTLCRLTCWKPSIPSVRAWCTRVYTGASEASPPSRRRAERCPTIRPYRKPTRSSVAPRASSSLVSMPPRTGSVLASTYSEWRCGSSWSAKAEDACSSLAA